MEQNLSVVLVYACDQCPEDKPYVESFFGHYKTEEAYRTAYTTLAEGQMGWPLYQFWYEIERNRESLEYQTPQRRTVTHAGFPGHRPEEVQFDWVHHKNVGFHE